MFSRGLSLTWINPYSIDYITVMNLEKKLVETGFFESLSAGSLKQLAEICILKKAEKKTVLFLEGREGGLFYV